MEILDEKPIVTQLNESDVVYSGFWIRFVAMLIDFLVLSPLIAISAYFNALEWKSVPILIVVSLIQIAYSPFCEFYYGATVGKMAMRIKVVNLEYEKINLTEAVVRNIFDIIPGLISLAFTVSIYGSAEYQQAKTFLEAGRVSSQMLPSALITWGPVGLAVVDAIVLIANSRKQSLHDIIAKTFVIQR